MAEIGQDINRAKTVLEEGGLVAIPTETVYGLAGNALDGMVVSKIFAAKNRPSFDPLIVHVESLSAVNKYVQEIPEKARILAEAYWPGPLTLLLKKKPLIPDLVTSGLETVAVRVPFHQMTRDLLSSIDFPLAAPSANPFGYVSPTTPRHVNDQLGDKIDYILDGGNCEVGIESTIISFEHDIPKVLRLGGLSVEAIEQVIGKVAVTIHSSSKPHAPGMLKSHYAPKKRIVLAEEVDTAISLDSSGTGALMFDHYFSGIEKENQFLLSKSGDLNEAAKRFFTGLRELDQNENIHTIITEFVPNEGLGRAINDRLKRATAK